MDIGCGAGRVALELQNRGLGVVGLESSPLAAKAAKLRGVNEVWLKPIQYMDTRIASFDSIVLFGNNFGIFETPTRARHVLVQLAEGTKLSARIFAESTSAYFGGAPAFDRSYYRLNKARGRSPGQVKLRYHYGHFVGPWFRWLYVTQSEMRSILVGTGWHLERVLGAHPSEPYVAILAKDSDVKVGDRL
jgi:SAM-dependent methyltransferase